MYTAFYGLREKPFALSPDPRFLYLAGSHREALAHLLYGIEQGEGFISITGEVGTGKTTLCRTLLERLDGDTELAFLFNPSRTALELLQSICAELELPAEGLTRRTLMAQLNTFLVAKKREGRRVLLIIDEAQTLSENTLEQVRLLSNLETSREKLIQILLLGQPELDRKLDGRGLRQLRQRISVRWQLDPLGAHETGAYVRHRLSVAAGEPKDLFSDAALREIHRRTGGIPRLVNQLCDRALLAGYAARAAVIGPRLVRAAAREIPDARRPVARGRRPALRDGASRPWVWFGASLALVGVSLFAGLQAGRYGLTDSLRASILGPDAPPADAHAGADGAASTPPAVSANAPATHPAPTQGAPRKVIDGRGPGGVALGRQGGPPLIELIGYVPDALREELGIRPSLPALPEALPPTAATEAAAEGSAGSDADLVASATSLALPPRPVRDVALGAGRLPELLAQGDPAQAFSDSRAALLERFGRGVALLAAAPASPTDLQRSLESRGLTATPFDGGSLELLRRLDHPVALPLAVRPMPRPTNTETQERWVALIGFDGDRARLAGLLPDQIVTIPIDELAAHWLENGIIVWQRLEPVPPLLASDAFGPGVRWLQQSLAELRFLDGAPTGRYDAATRDAVRRFQRDRGLVADGLAGPLTQIALYGQLDRYPVPRLSRTVAAARSGDRG